ncbi:MAG: hypothetical protein ABI597_03130 [Gammaproteobacteria bacterium]
MMLRNVVDLNLFLEDIVRRVQPVNQMPDSTERASASMDNIVHLTELLEQTQLMSELYPKNKLLKIALASIHYAIAGQILIKCYDTSTVSDSKEYLEDKMTWEYCMQTAIKIATALKQSDLKNIFKNSLEINRDTWVIQDAPCHLVPIPEQKLSDTESEIDPMWMREIERSNTLLKNVIDANQQAATLADFDEREKAFGAVFDSLQAIIVDVQPNSILLGDINSAFASTLVNKWQQNEKYGIRSSNKRNYVDDKVDWQKRISQAMLIYSEKNNSICKTRLAKIDETHLATQEVWNKLDREFQRKDSYLVQSFFVNVSLAQENSVLMQDQPVKNHKRKMSF